MTLQHSLLRKGMTGDFSCFLITGMLSENLRFTPSIGQRKPPNPFKRGSVTTRATSFIPVCTTLPGLAYHDGLRHHSINGAPRPVLRAPCRGARRCFLSKTRHRKGKTIESFCPPPLKKGKEGHFCRWLSFSLLKGGEPGGVESDGSTGKAIDGNDPSPAFNRCGP